MLRHLFWPALVGFVVIAFVVWAVLSGPGVSEANYSRIKEGMSREEVEAILGDPSAGRAEWRKIIIWPRPELPLDGTETRWRESDRIIIIQFDKNEIVIHKSMHGEPESFGERIRWRIGLH